LFSSILSKAPSKPPIQIFLVQRHKTTPRNRLSSKMETCPCPSPIDKTNWLQFNRLTRRQIVRALIWKRTPRAITSVRFIVTHSYRVLFLLLRTLINYLIVHSKLSEERIASESFRLFPASETLREIFQLLARKFRKLRKTKEEMVKYCIRKAFKYVT
jgi:hypothetical protein